MSYSGSFPFLNVAREHGVPYLDVIQFVENIPTDCKWWQLTGWQAAAHDAWLLEADRRWNNRNNPKVAS